MISVPSSVLLKADIIRISPVHMRSRFIVTALSVDGGIDRAERLSERRTTVCRPGRRAGTAAAARRAPPPGKQKRALQPTTTTSLVCSTAPALLPFMIHRN